MSNSRWQLFLATLYSLLAVVHASSSTGGAFPKPAFVTSTESNTELVSNSNNETTTTAQDPPISIPEWKRKLPYPLNNKTSTFQRIIIPGFGGRCIVEVYLLGTAHVSNDSSRDVSLLLETIDPDVIFLEICDQRIPMLTAPPPKAKAEGETAQQSLEDSKKKPWWRRPRRKKKESTAHEEGGGQPKSLREMASHMLTSMQEDYADSLGVELGGEFRTAYNFWEQSLSRPSGTIHMILGDRPLYLTLTRAWESLGIWGKTKLLVALFISTLQKPNPEELKKWMKSILEDDSGDILTKSIEELKKHFPTLEEVIIRERDAYMACKLYQTCRQMLIMQQQEQQRQPQSSLPPSSPSIQRVVAIVGAGHVNGMCHWLTGGNQGKGTPEDVLAGLIKIKKEISNEDARVLTHDVMVVNHEQLQEMVQQR
mmetsp:Transcript_494/g.797  ORF Transcript_494/g.797 Transcript_494/m.797 type:complete len:425 (-) Transcript_494:59-1333(-)|eukprot:CAMPEP_0113608174 /NCGR_PEP_ID=MMETSP0017_2-20120614/3777_1 /TAXON_ID=2856 /ORGANISM="Cylindrotheca closterium" /LENGTH=424 /DNA_ID=CAMNT_0000516827 /DNA_START=46 /DNA_END=1320 /DNA_ORIENTATION=+ /assembly_acc=CAM_ASM_000147